MTSYAFDASDRTGRRQRGTIAADSVESAHRRLRDQGLLPLEIVRAPAPRTSSLWGRRMRTRDLGLGLQALATLLEAGLPLDQALGALDTMAPATWRRFVPELRGAVRGGASLGAAMDRAELALPPAVRGIIGAGEGGSGLTAGIRRGAELLEAEAELRSAIRSALAYPLLLGLAGAGALVLLVGVVLPRFAVILEDLGQTLPTSTRLVLGGADVIRIAGLPTLGALVFAGGGWRLWIRSEDGRRRWDALLLRLPVVGPIRHARATAQACTALSALLQTGCPLPAALRHASDASGDGEVARRLESVREQVTRGERLARSLEATEAVTDTAVRLVAAGERSGRLADMTGRAGALEAAETERTITKGVKLLEPLLILGFGGLVAVVAAALLQAVYAVRPVP